MTLIVGDGKTIDEVIDAIERRMIEHALKKTPLEQKNRGSRTRLEPARVNEKVKKVGE